MEVLLFALFFISALVFFIAGKDDFGRTNNKLVMKEKVKKEENTEPSVEVKKEENIKPSVEVKKEENIKPSVEAKKEENIKPSVEVKKEE
tara:strand:- start:183 stop:452 length:270 start_codon:yes stop_codon:yes gene_type:complete